MRGRIFLDSNVLVYLYDTDAPGKQARARILLHGLSGNAFLSTQVLQELYVNVARKFAHQLFPRGSGVTL